MISTNVHNYLVPHVHNFLFSLDIVGVEEESLVIGMDNGEVEFQVTELVSHNGCLHPVGEPCLCDCDSDE